MKIITHNGRFHPDDAFSAALLTLLHEGKETIEIIRTRDQNIIATGDIVFDVGGVYNREKKLFDHHQVGGAGARDNNIPYAAFGLLWKEYGQALCEKIINNMIGVTDSSSHSFGEMVATVIDQKIVQPIDAHDNGVETYVMTSLGVNPLLIDDVIYNYNLSWKEGGSEAEHYKCFMQTVEFAQSFLKRYIEKIVYKIEGQQKVQELYSKAEDKRIITLDAAYPWSDILSAHPEPLYVIYPEDTVWHVSAVRKEGTRFESRKLFPETWGGLSNEDLARVTGIPDAVFCHKGNFFAVVKSYEGALALVKKSLAQ